MAAKAAQPKYGIRNGFRFRQSDAPALAKAFLALEKRLGRPPTAEDVVEEARNPKSPFFAVFEAANLWDDAYAAQQARIVYARKVIEAISVTIVHGHESYEVRGFIPARYTGDDPNAVGYTSTLSSVARRRAYLQRLHEEARRLNEQIAAWAWLLSLEPEPEPEAMSFIAAIKKFAEAPAPA